MTRYEGMKGEWLDPADPLAKLKPEKRDIYPQKGSQLMMLTSNATEVFMGGESGGGKSFGFLLDFLEDIGKAAANGLFLRRHFADLEPILHEAIPLYRGYGAVFNESKHAFTFPSGARLRFGHMNTPRDVYNYTGAQRTHYYWDELCQFPRMPYLLLMAWLRSPDDTIFKRIRSSGNPDGEGFLWVKDRFIDKLEPFEKAWFTTKNDRDYKVAPGTSGAMLRQFIPCYREENLALMEKDPGYRDRLEQLPEEKKRAYKYGIWDASDRPFQVVRTKDWVKAINGENRKRPGLYGLGADYAESGDRCALCIGFGNQVRKFKEYPGMETPEFAKIILNEAKGCADIMGARNVSIGVDSIGPGTGVFHALKANAQGFRIDPMKYKDKAYDRQAADSAYKIRFNNLRSQMWWKLKEDMAAGNIDLADLQGEKGYYENLHLLQEEVLAHTYKEEGGVIKIVGKDVLRDADHLNRSPDRADALVIWNWVRERHREHRPGTPVDLHFTPEATRMREQIRRRMFAADDQGIVQDDGDLNAWQSY
jgi:hypothetical protein